jgi:hypothetical protein
MPGMLGTHEKEWWVRMVRNIQPYLIDLYGSKEFAVNGNIVGGCSGAPLVYKRDQKIFYIRIR